MTIIILSVNACTTSHRTLASFKSSAEITGSCYDRKSEPYTSVVDSHIHFRPFGGPAIPFAELMDYFDKSGVRFANVYGIGQILPIESSCIYYLDCPGHSALPSIKNDFANAVNYLEYRFDQAPEKVHLVFSMTFADLANPENIVDRIHLYDEEFPEMFHWMGEVNVIKQALLENNHQPASKDSIRQWAGFMKLLKDRDIPLNLHSDLGNDQEPTKFLPLMEEILKLYPDNKIIWSHMGLSLELTKMQPEEHIRIMQSMLDNHPNLMLDISWRVLYDTYFYTPEYRVLYVDFLNQYSDRILTGTDFVAAQNKTYKIYLDELEVVSRINQYLNDEAFRNIALGDNYFRLLGLDYTAPRICQ